MLFVRKPFSINPDLQTSWRLFDKEHGSFQPLRFDLIPTPFCFKGLVKHDCHWYGCFVWVKMVHCLWLDV